MGTKKKKRLYAEADNSEYIIQPTYEELKEDFTLKGNWKKSYFENNNNIIIEVACGKGEYSVGLAALYPTKNFIGIDIKSDRLVRGAREADALGLKNVAFIRTRVENLPFLFDEKEVSEIWVVFPDPLPKKSKIRKRLTNSRFLNIYQKVLVEKGIIHLKTDDLPFYNFTLETLSDLGFEVLIHKKDIYQSPFDHDVRKIQTYYEKKWLTEGRKIHYLKRRAPVLKKNI